MKSIAIFLLLLMANIRLNLFCMCTYCLESPAILEGDQCMSDLYPTDNMLLLPLWENRWAYPIEAVIIGLLIFMATHYRLVRNKKRFSDDTLRVALSIIRKTRTPLTLIQNLLEDISNSDIPESASVEIKRVLGHVSHVIDRYLNVMTLENMDEKLKPGFKTIEFELSAYITSVTEQCRRYSEMHHVQLKISKNFDRISCRVNETIMTAALQCIFEKMIDITPREGCVYIMISHFTGFWNLQITNNPESGRDKKYQRLIWQTTSLVKTHYYGNLRFINKIIRSHGGKMTIITHGHSVTFQIVIPLDSQHDTANNRMDEMIQSGYSQTEGKNNEVSSIPDTSKPPHILLIMSDKELNNYLNKTLSETYRITILEDPEQTSVFFSHRNSDIIIIDEIVDGRYGGDLCSEIKSNVDIFNIPIILLTGSNDNESYLAHICCGADKLEHRMASICRLKADIRTLIHTHNVQLERIRQSIIKTQLANFPQPNIKTDTSIQFMEKVEKLLEKNLSANSYTVDMLNLDMCMSRTACYNRIKDITGKSPKEYMDGFKMNKARILLLSQQYSITEIASLLGFCDAKYFGKKFKDYYHCSPTEYVKKNLE